MPDKIVMTIGAAGNAEAMHFDKFPLGFLGKQSIKRASEILFDEESQDWYILATGQIMPYPAACGFKEYEEARKFEVEWFQTARQASCEPVSENGRTICETLRY